MNILKQVTAGILSISILSLIFIAQIIPMHVYAQGTGINETYTLLEPLPCINGNTASSTTPGCVDGKVSSFQIDYYITYAFRLAIAVAALAAVVTFTYGGFEYMVSESSITNQKTARDRMKNAVIGLLAVLGSYLILNTIDPRLVNVSTQIKPLELKTTSLNLNQLTIELGQQARVVREQIADADRKIGEANMKISDLYAQLENATSSNEQDRIMLEIERTNNTKNSLLGQSALLLGKTLINQQINQAQNSVDEVTRVKNRINNTYIEQQKIIIESGNQDLLAPLTDMKNYALAVADINMDVVSLKDKGREYSCRSRSDQLITPIIAAKIASLNSRISQIDSITDPALKTKLAEARRIAFVTIQNYEVPECNIQSDVYTP